MIPCREFILESGGVVTISEGLKGTPYVGLTENLMEV
jgi:hypothetical protein